MSNNIIMQNNIINGDRNSVSVNNRTVTINGLSYPMLESMHGNSSSIIDNKIFIDGYELKNGKWKKTIRALWHLWF